MALSVAGIERQFRRIDIQLVEMKMNGRQVISSLLFAAGVATVGGLVYANQGATTANDAATDLARASISLVQAIGNAEAQAGGKATKAELEGEHGAPVFNVEVVTAARTVFDVKIDAADGKLLSSRADKADGNDTDSKDEKDEKGEKD